MFYYLGWFIIFLSVLLVTHFLSKHLRFIVISFIKIYVAASITLFLASLVYVYEHVDVNHIEQFSQTIYKRMIELRDAQL